MKIRHKILILVLAGLFFLIPTLVLMRDVEVAPRNIILFIGDGMGVAHLTAGKVVAGELQLERFQTMGLLMTSSADKLVTDSAAAGTALATGYKVNNNAVSFSPAGEKVKTVLEYAEEAGKATGIVVSSSITHATPASFLAHTPDRWNETFIAEEILKSGVDVLIGGGWGYFIPEGEEGSERKDEQNLLPELEKKFPVVRSLEELHALGEVERVAILLAPKQLPRVSERSLSLAELTTEAIKILSQNEAGFFLMVEGSQIDWAGHGQNKDYIIEEVIDFDRAVGVGLNFAELNKNTLVVVTADHETGGLSLHEGSIKEKTLSEMRFTSDYHTATMVPLFAYGKGSEVFGGIHENTFVGAKLIEYVQK